MKAVYLHIPFCHEFCSYCDFCKLYYNQKLVDDYLIALKEEIERNYKGELIETIYIGGGTPSSLNLKQLTKLFTLIYKFKVAKECEFTIECNLDVSLAKLILFKKNNVNRLSLGIQTFNKTHLKLLNRKHTIQQAQKVIEQVRKIGITNINVDLIYGIPKQTLPSLKTDLDKVLNLNITHLSTYALSIEKHTKLYLANYTNIDPTLEYEMYKYILTRLQKHNFIHYEISNFAQAGYQAKHNLTYWHNEPYYGFGLGAHGYTNNIRYENTRNITKYINNEFLYQKEIITDEDKMIYEMILGLRKIKGINKQTFKEKYNQDLLTIFNIQPMIDNKDLIDDGNNIFIPLDKIYISNEILMNFVKEKEAL